MGKNKKRKTYYNCNKDDLCCVFIYERPTKDRRKEGSPLEEDMVIQQFK